MAYPVFDLHCDTADMLALGYLSEPLKPLAAAIMPGELTRHTFDTYPGHLSSRTVGTTPWAECMACFVPDPVPPEAAVLLCHDVFDHLADEEAAGRLTVAQHARDLRSMLEQGGFTAIKTLENAKAFAHDPELVHAYAEQGVLMASLSWNGAGPLASGHDDEAQGLTAAGRNVIRRMEDEHMVLDVSHLNDASFADVCACATRPFAASHSNSRAICPHPRGLTDAQFAEIRDRGGVVGFNFENSFIVDTASDPQRVATFDDISRHIEHWLDLGGEGVLALGGDFDGSTTPDVLKDASALPAFQELLEQRFGAAVTRKMCFGNALGFFERWAA